MLEVRTILLAHTLAATLQHLEETAEIAPNSLGLIEFKETLIEKIAQLKSQIGDVSPIPLEDAHAYETAKAS